jgi:hypothetical protein
MKIKEDAPILFSYHYVLDTLKFKKFLEENEDLCEGALGMQVFGIKLLNIEGVKKWELTDFYITNEEGKRMSIPLMQEEVVIAIHRDIFSDQEWVITMDTGQIAAQQTDM